MKEKALNKTTLIAILICSYCNAQTSDFIVTTAQDTIYVDKINLTAYEVKTKTAGKKKKYQMDEIINYYLFGKNKHYERILLEKKEVKAPDKYDYRRNENSFLDKNENVDKYKYIQRLTTGKVKLFAEVVEGGTVASGTPGQPGYMPSTRNQYNNYYISVYESKLEPIKLKFKLFDFSKGLELTNEVYEILKIYLYGNSAINKKLDSLLISKPIAKEKQIIDLINEYNKWAESNK